MIRQVEFQSLKIKYLRLFLVNVKLLLPTFFYSNNFFTVSSPKFFFFYKFSYFYKNFFFFFAYFALTRSNLPIVSTAKFYINFLWKKSKKVINFKAANKLNITFKLRFKQAKFLYKLNLFKTYARYNLNKNFSCTFFVFIYASQKISFFFTKIYFLLLFQHLFYQNLHLLNVMRGKVYLFTAFNTLPNFFTQKSLLQYNQLLL